ncbi:MAG: class II fumarate hydratase [Bacteroidales bacterium]|jgi:fumarate hydratase class II|nr:class II fumarate hydratase [Bacteroidales bacterium]
MEYRIEKDTLGEVNIPKHALWGAQTQRSIQNFQIGNELMPLEIIYAIIAVKRAAALANFDCGALQQEKKDLIVHTCEQLLQAKYNDSFPLCVWQTGSGTQTNMNVNEVISHLAASIFPDMPALSPNDDVNKSQSTNDVFPTAMRISASFEIVSSLIPALEKLIQTFRLKSKTYKEIQKIGRTHLMDATPLTLGDEFSAFTSQLEHGLDAISLVMPHLFELPIGGTAVGNGINAPDGYDQKVIDYLSETIDLPFQVAPNKFEAMASHDTFVELSGSLKRLAVSLTKIGNDIRLLSSGPRCGLGEITIPANEPGSSIMPGKVNPTQCEALTMVCCQVIGNDTAITTGALQGHLQLNVFMPLIAKNILHSIRILTDAMHSFCDHCVVGIEPNLPVIQKHLNNSLMRITKLNPHIGYYNAAKIAQYAHQNDLTLKEAAIELQILSAEQFDQFMNQ